MKRIVLAVTIVAAAIAAAAFATVGSADSPAKKKTSLHLVSTTQAGVGFAPRHDARPGDRFATGDIITGDETGIDRVTCTVIGEDDALCTAVAKLSKGMLTAETLVNLRVVPEPAVTHYAITGGTGAYAGASGTAVVTEVTGTDKANIVVTLDAR